MADLPASLAANPRLGDWVRVLPTGVIEIRSGKVELGQGVLTALAQIAAEELDVGIGQIRMIPAVTGTSPDEGYTAGSHSVDTSGAAIRVAAAEVRAIYVAAAAVRWGVAAEALAVKDGMIEAPDGRRFGYGELCDDRLLDRAAGGLVRPKEASEYRIVGTSSARLDLPAKLSGRPPFVHDLAFPGMLYGRVVRPPSPAARLLDVDTAPVLALPGVVTVVRDGTFLGVLAEREEVAVRAADRLRTTARWREVAGLPDEDRLPEFLTSAPAESCVLAEHGRAGGPSTSHQHTATFHRPYLAHASLGPSGAAALASPSGPVRLTIWTHSQGVYWVRRAVAHVLGIDERDVVVNHVDGPGCYGHNGADDAALDAALLALEVPGRPVQVVWSRADEFQWEPFGPAAAVRIEAALDEGGDVLHWRCQIWGSGHTTRPSALQPWALLAASHRSAGRPIEPAAEPPMANGGGAGRNAVPGYAFPGYQVTNHRLTVMPLRTSSLRSLGAFVNVFAIESFMDELAAVAGRDPVEYRLAQLEDPRARAVIEAAVHRSGWRECDPVDSVGSGLGYARYKNTAAYCAVVAEVEAINRLRVRRLTIAVDAGLVINPDGAVNQIEGGAIQAVSWTVKERVRFDRTAVTSDSWETYPILRFTEVPVVDVELMPSGGNPPLGIGEVSQGPTAAAIANALHAAIGVRVRTLPLTHERIAEAAAFGAPPSRT